MVAQTELDELKEEFIELETKHEMTATELDHTKIELAAVKKTTAKTIDKV